ncbi:MAG: MaoC family dehydratase [Candidatus Jordarchaeum sp.]|uniref:MaoC family dehydratase n=1 Tax=Candidatus Jordarchaeum sp. TaxID=2823881 RepID=UPI00404B8969
MTDKVKFEDVMLDDELPIIEVNVTQELISRFACGSLDFNPIHVDPIWASEVNLFGMGKTIAHGQWTIALMTQVITNWCYADGGRLKSIDIKLIRPVFPGDTVKFCGKVVAKHPRTKEMSFVDLELWVDNQNGDKVAVGKAQAYLP